MNDKSPAQRRALLKIDTLWTLDIRENWSFSCLCSLRLQCSAAWPVEATRLGRRWPVEMTMSPSLRQSFTCTRMVEVLARKVVLITLRLPIQNPGAEASHFETFPDLALMPIHLVLAPSGRNTRKSLSACLRRQSNDISEALGSVRPGPKNT
jgi:hypothetical protein